MSEKANPVRPNTSAIQRSGSQIRITKQSALVEKKRQLIERELEFVDRVKQNQAPQMDVLQTIKTYNKP